MGKNKDLIEHITEKLGKIWNKTWEAKEDIRNGENEDADFELTDIMRIVEDIEDSVSVLKKRI
jgi:hypothetical protein